MNILLAEDDPYTRRALVEIFESERWSVTPAADGQKAWDAFSAGRFDIVCLDIMMPGKSGYDLCRQIREKDKTIPILFISAKAEEVDKVLGLELGADDFIVKPFGAREVTARIRAVQRRFERSANGSSPSAEDEKFSFGEWEIDPGAMRAMRNTDVVELTEREMRLVSLFFRNAGQVLSRVRIFQLVWGWEEAPQSRTLDQHIAVLRKKLDDRDQRLIKTIQGVGYRYEGP